MALARIAVIPEYNIMPDFIKIDSDRPDFHQQILDQTGEIVDLRDASAAYLLMWSSAGDLLVNDSATIDTPILGEVVYDFDREQIFEAGTNEIEIRIEWQNGDRQWFPEDEPGYEMEVVPSAGDREADLTGSTATEDASVHRLHVYDAIDVQDPDGEMVIANGDVAITGGDLTVSGSTTLGAISVADDDAITYGTHDDFETAYDSTDDEWQLINAIGGIDIIQASKGGNVTFPNGTTISEDQTLETDATEANLQYVSSGSPTAEVYVRGLLEDSNAIGDSVVTIGDTDTGVGPIQFDGATGDAEYDGTVEAAGLTIGGDTVATRAWAQADNIAHADLADAPADSHHAEVVVENSGVEIASGSYTFDFGAGLVPSDNGDGSVTIDGSGLYTDENAQDAVGEILNDDHFNYDDAVPEIEFVAGNVAHDDHSGINGTNHHAALTIEDSGTEVTVGDYTLNFGTDLSAAESGGTVTIDATGGGGSGYSDADAIDAINNDGDHGSTAQHDYFSGAHSDLTGVGSDDHHTKTTVASDLTDVSADSVSDAHHTKTAASDVTSSNWGDMEIFVQDTEPAGWSDGDIWLEPSN